VAAPARTRRELVQPAEYRPAAPLDVRSSAALMLQSIIDPAALHKVRGCDRAGDGDGSSAHCAACMHRTLRLAPCRATQWPRMAPSLHDKACLGCGDAEHT
jgi:hypothetical protein